jgi:hypothetical protein
MTLPDPITWGHVLILLAALIGLYGLAQLVIWLRHRGPQHGRGTPGYARARDGRRYATWSILAALILVAIACLTPLCRMAIA